MTEAMTVVSGIILDEGSLLSLTEITYYCGADAETVLNMVNEGLLEPLGDTPGNWRFPCSQLRRARAALRLQRDLELNLPGAALVLDLLDELHRLRARVRALESTPSED